MQQVAQQRRVRTLQRLAVVHTDVKILIEICITLFIVVFFTVSQYRHVLVGPVVVSKMPALHPGDVRKLQAVDVPDLKHLRDVIVFPQKVK